MRRSLATGLALVALAAFAALASARTGDTTVGRRQNGKLVHVALGGRLVVRLPENGSTGYGWRLVARPARSVLRLSKVYVVEPPAGNPPRVGQAGTRVYVFRDAGPGRTSLEIDLFPPARGTRAAQRYRLRVASGSSRSVAPRFTG